jgi:hypothetical protein
MMSSSKDRANTGGEELAVMDQLKSFKHLSLNSELSEGGAEKDKLSLSRGLSISQVKRAHRSESMNLFDAELAAQGNFHIIKRTNRSGSVYIPPKIHDSILEKHEKAVNIDSSLFLKDRGILRYLL